MQKKLTIMINEQVYEGVYRVIGRLSGEDLRRVEQAIRVQLALDR